MKLTKKFLGGSILQVIQLGSFIINAGLLIFIISAFIAYYGVKYDLLKLGIEVEMREKFAQALMMGFFIWKFSPLIFNTKSILDHPLSLLYFDGGERGLILAFFLSIMFIAWRIRKEQSTVPTNMKILVFSWIIGSSVYHLLWIIADPTMLLYRVLFIISNVALGICLYSRQNTANRNVSFIRCIMWYSIAVIALFFIQPHRYYLVSGFTKEQVFFFLALVALFLYEQTLIKQQKNSGDERISQ